MEHLRLSARHHQNLTLNVAPRQNNSRLDELSSKVSALRGVTVDIYDNARDQGVLDSSVSARRPSSTLVETDGCATQNEVFSNLSTSIRGSAGRLGRMAQQGNKVAIFKLAGMIVGVVLGLWFLTGLLWRWRS